LSVIEKTSGIFGKGVCLEFHTIHKTIEDFLDPQISPAKKILYVKTQESETEFVSMQIYKKLSTTDIKKDTYIMMKTSFGEESFKSGVKVFEKSDSFKFMIIEVDSEDSLFEKFRSQIETTLQSPSKRLIVIAVKSKIKFSDCTELDIDPFHPKDLTDASLAQVLNRPVNFQKTQTTWKEILAKNNILLKDLLRIKEIAANVLVSKSINENLYIPRTFLYQNWLELEVLNEFSSDDIVYNQQDYEAKFKSKTVHWLEKDREILKWMRSSRDISRILKYINERESEKPKEDSMISKTPRISIVIDVAGMGKSTVLNQLAQKLKKKYANHWVIKVDLNDYTNELDEVSSDELKTCKEAIEFLSNKILKLSSVFEKDLFRHSCETDGEVVLLFDGFDEVASFYQEQVTHLIRSLLKTSVGKIFIASRPECAVYLEKEFLQIRHSLQPFSKENQESYLFKFMKEKVPKDVDEDSLKRIIETIPSLMSESLSDRDYKFTGVPLITKLVAEFFESKICGYFREGSNKVLADFIAELKRESFNLFKLYQYFVDKSLEIYYRDKCRMELSNPKIKKKNEKEMIEILNNYEMLAVQQILKTDLEKHLPTFKAKKIDEDELEVLVQVGMIYQIGRDFKFIHQTYGEFGFNKFLRNNFDDEDCAKFISEVVLVDESFKIIRSFVNFWILDKINGKTCGMYQKKLLGSPVDNKETPLHVAGQESNENIFWFLYSSLAVKTEIFEGKRLEIESYLLRLPTFVYDSEISPYIAFVYYFQNCDDFNILSEIQKDFGLDFVKKIFTHKMIDGQNFLHGICRRDCKNVSKVLNFARDFFSQDPEFLKELLLSPDEYGHGFLHYAFKFVSNDKLLGLFEELKKFKWIPEFGQDFVNKLLLMRTIVWGVFLCRYAQNKYFENHFFLEFLKQLKFLCDEETLREFFLVADDKYGSIFLHDFCLLTKNFDLLQTLKWVAEEFNSGFLKDLILSRDNEGQTIVHKFISFSDLLNVGSQFLSILKIFKYKSQFEDAFVTEEILFREDNKGDCLFIMFFKKTHGIDFYSLFFEFLVNDLNLVEDNLKKFLSKIKSIMFWISQITDKSVRDEIWRLLSLKFGGIFHANNFYSNEILEEICEKYSKDYNIDKFINYLNFIEEKNNLGFLKNYISGTNQQGQTILFKYYHEATNLIEILEWLKTKFEGNKQFEILLLKRDKNGDSFFTSVLKNCYDWDVDSYFTKIYNFFPSKTFLSNLLLIENNDKKNFFNLVCERSELEITDFLDLFSNDFQNDRGFIKRLINEKFKENEKVKEWMRENGFD
jgi:hypothetical protein